MGCITELLNWPPELRVVIIEDLTEEIIQETQTTTWSDVFLRPLCPTGHSSGITLTFDDLKANAIIAHDVNTAIFGIARWIDLDLNFSRASVSRFLEQFDMTETCEVANVDVVGNVVWRADDNSGEVQNIQIWMEEDLADAVSNLGWFIDQFRQSLRRFNVTVSVFGYTCSEELVTDIQGYLERKLGALPNGRAKVIVTNV